MKTETTRLFIPVNSEVFEWYMKGLKRWELRATNRQYSSKCVSMGRMVEVRRGYNGESVWGRIGRCYEGKCLMKLLDMVDFREVIPTVSSIEEAVSVVDSLIKKQEKYILIEILLDESRRSTHNQGGTVMDTTPKYILMSEKALGDLAEFQPHIQHEEIPCGANVVEIDYNGNWWFNRDNKTLIPLFRQDQLQEMAFPDARDTVNIRMNRFVNQFCLLPYVTSFDKWAGETATYWFTTEEQLWLAFVMSEKYQKSWNGKDWVKK